MAFSDWFRKEMSPSAFGAIGALWSRLGVSSATCWRRAEVGGLPGAGGAERAGGPAALRSGQPFDVVLTDIEMPT